MTKADPADWSTCPYCDGGNIEGDRPWIEGGEIVQIVYCHDCKTAWYECYVQSHREDCNGDLL